MDNEPDKNENRIVSLIHDYLWFQREKSSKIKNGELSKEIDIPVKLQRNALKNSK